MMAGIGVAIGARRMAELIGELQPGVAYYRAVADRIGLLIADGLIAVGTRLPSERDLAGAVDRSRSTIVAAYDLLRDRGYARSRQGSGTVAQLPATPIRRTPIDFAHAVPEPIPGIADYLKGAALDVERALAGPSFDLQGDAELRSRIADHYADQKVPTRAAQIVVTIGGQHAISTLTGSLIRRGDRVLMDSPCYPHAYQAVQANGGRVLTTPVTEDGWDLEHYVTALRRFRPAAAYLMPDFQNPTGASMPPAARRLIAETAAQTGTVLIVDETTAQLDIDRGWTDGPMCRYAAAVGAEIVTIGSLSKSIWGGLRVGWIRASQKLIQQVLRRRPSYDLGTPRLEQLVACRLLPDLPILYQRRSQTLRESRDHLLAELATALPEWRSPKPAGGLSLWVQLPRPTGTALAAIAQTRGLLVSAGPRFTLDASHERFLRLPFTEAKPKLSHGVSLLASIWTTLDPTSDSFIDLLDAVV